MIEGKRHFVTRTTANEIIIIITKKVTQEKRKPFMRSIISKEQNVV